jgi:hypothetical protein
LRNVDIGKGKSLPILTAWESPGDNNPSQEQLFKVYDLDL